MLIGLIIILVGLVALLVAFLVEKDLQDMVNFLRLAEDFSPSVFIGMKEYYECRLSKRRFLALMKRYHESKTRL